MEESKFKRTLITTALPYANGPVHIGHLAAYTCLPTSTHVICACAART